MNSVNIGYDAKRLFCNRTGLGNYSRTLVKNLYQHFPESQYHLYSPESRDIPDSNFFSSHKHIQTHIPNPTIKSLWRSRGIIKDLKKDNINLFHGLSNELPMGLAQNNIKSIVTIHDLIFKRLPETYKAIDRSIYDYKSKYSCTHSDKIVAISKSTKNDLIEFYNIDPNKIQVIYQSCNPIFYSDKDLSPQLETKLQSYKLPTEYLLYVGSVEPRKNLKLILEAYGQLQDKDIPPLVIIGKARSYKKIFNQMKSSSAIADKIIWIENLENNELLKEIYKKASILLYPSLYEGFGLPVAEALLTKTPVISSNISSLPEAGGPDTIYINPHKVEELSVAIQKVLSNTELQTRMKGRGYAYAMKNFDPLNISKQWMSCYEEVL